MMMTTFLIGGAVLAIFAVIAAVKYWKSKKETLVLTDQASGRDGGASGAHLDYREH